jgi:hypothetical protein
MHKKSDYTPECEEIRMINISQSLGQPTIFIRFNPDAFKKNGKVVKNNISSEKFKVLKQVLDNCLKIVITEIQQSGFCSMIQLFYDDFDKNNIRTTTILPFES